MSAKPTSIRIAEDTRRAIEYDCSRTGRSFSGLANEMLAEAVKMRRIPGIAFQDAPSGRTAVIAGTGLEVFEIVRSCREIGCDWEQLGEAYHWLTEAQLRAALAYASAYPDEIEPRIALDEYWTPERVWATYPFMRPSWR